MTTNTKNKISIVSYLMRGLSKLSTIGRALMLPISILPAAGLLLAFGDKFQIPLMLSAGDVIFSNLPLLFAVGAAVGLAKESGIAALAAVVAMLVMNITIGVHVGITPEMAQQGGAYAFVLGIPSLQMGVFGGLIAGILAATMYNRFHNIELPAFLGFFAGKRFVPIVTAFSAFILGLILPSFWMHVQSGIDAMSTLVNGDNQALSTFIFGFTERALIPLGLHHIWYPPFWFSFGEFTTNTGAVITGDQTIWFKMLAEGVKSFDSETYHGAGKFMQGEFPLMLFALPAACLAMYNEAKTKNKKFAAGILFSAALTCFLTGITEPVEFTFIFVSPLLYIFNAICAGGAYMCMHLLDAHLAKSFSAGFIDYLSLGIMPSLNGFETNYLAAVIVGIPMAILYYFVFRFVIRKFNVQTPGRTDEEQEENTMSIEELSQATLGYLGGKDNLTSVTSCITRLRLEVKDKSLINSKALEDLGAMGVINVGEKGVQVIFGAKAQFIADYINKQ
ncbi:PTS transporter subunit EIIC [Pasteurella atlantica]|uniref:PTS transporter subunit EIIC n=1 Tax=Pasteurellaceae TaxID=712 RepID=UPI00274F94A3|nr:PTS transporter subunit EIIC [Pasteurella atlantica]MDP8033350.1 PTS transporter subunit EIIC [Pasteurella atlantica]MDP8035286.1 PTS transporter subunit EIIC [Pasteurella atlantica]MDP8037237.1 PTS transporter subunit EIIC [Pasteurella atlantica]MDP8047650.1 PTS transporter subunit EIIC [Pasteurella atlantica]MDP8049539.1 PTS transporter subunit EIIC [Pasteurella atlantica]